MNRLILTVSLLILLTWGCSKPVVDGSTEESMQTSLNEIRQTLSAEQKTKFEQALVSLSFAQVDMSAIASGNTNADEITSNLREIINGKTAEEIIGEADKVRLVQEAKAKEQALNEIAELEQKKRSAENAKIELAKFEVIRSRFYKRERRYGSPTPVIELTVKNGTRHAVSRAYFSGIVKSPDRSVPWIKETFNYSIAGGVEPGEEASWSLAPNQFSEWGTTEVPADAVFTVETYRIDDASEEKLFSSEDFSDRDAERLAELKDKYETND